MRMSVFFVILIVMTTALGFSQAQNREDRSGGDGKADAKEEKPIPIPPENNSVTHHEMTLDGKTLRYTATAGTLLIDGDDGKPYGSVFYVAYSEDGLADGRKRPVTFLYNGGPGGQPAFGFIWARLVRSA